MKRRKQLSIAAIGAIGLLAFSSGAFAHPTVTLQDAGGNDILQGSSVPYSPKQTCGSDNNASYCHRAAGYESDITNAVKTDADSVSINVPYPQHGVTAGYHFQQGRNHDWGDVQRHFYHLPDFTSSGGMWGKY